MIIDHLKKFKGGGAEARNGFAPTGAAIVGREHNAVERRGGGVNIARDEDIRADGIDRGDFEKHVARPVLRAGEAERIDVLRRAGVIDMHGGLREERNERDQQEAGLHEILTVQYSNVLSQSLVLTLN